ncbi:MAG: DUF87 domain-containing protein [Mycoplasmatota bacterium]|nr:DUF87 domain-containing protein [Mycoplasmatota bacterium]
MIGTITEIIDNNVYIKLAIDIAQQPNLVGLHVVFDDGKKRVVGEIANTNREQMTVNIVGEIKDGFFTPGSSAKPSFKSTPRLIKAEELSILLGDSETKDGQTNFGTSNIYEGYKINVAINEFFNAHFSILGNSGAGKSCTVASILQKLFTSSPTPPTNANLFFFDAYGEYSNAFSKLHEHNPALNYKSYTTNLDEADTEILRIPIWLLDVDDLALLLDVTTPSQLPILEKTLKLVPILTGEGDSVIKKKNDIIARALQDILLSGNDSTKIRDQVIGVLTKFNTPTLSLNSQIVQPGYTRTLKQCLFVDKTGKMQEMELVVEFVRGYIQEESTDVNPSEMNPFYSLADLELAMDFALISEGILKSDKVFDYANVISVRLHTLVTGEAREYFSYPNYVTRDEFIEDLLLSRQTGGKCQIVNFNINYIDDRLAKVITKILSRMLFKKASTIKPRGSRAFHIIIEEAHRYVQHDGDVELLGYNIFERISKEGRKYGMFLALITQRPSELSDTCVSQCMNFIILRTLHPVDLEYIRTMVPNVSSEIVLQLKNLKPGNCIAFGSAFKVPTQLYVDLPNPRPLSNNVDLEKVWYKSQPVESVSGTLGNVGGVVPAPQGVAPVSSPVSPAPVMSQGVAAQAVPVQQVAGVAPVATATLTPQPVGATVQGQPSLAPQGGTFIPQNT